MRDEYGVRGGSGGESRRDFRCGFRWWVEVALTDFETGDGDS